MIYSVWNQADRIYDYYRTAEKSHDTSAPKPSHLKPTKYGATPEQAAWPLPKGAVKVGRGKYPKGHVAHPSGGLGLGSIPFGLTTTSIVVYGLGGWLAYKYLLKGGR